jgi:palmitoyltransferase
MFLGKYMLNLLADPSKPWPPPDPDRVYRAPRAPLSGDGFTQSMDIDDFRRRQEADLQRYQNGEQVTRRRPFHERYAQSEQADDYYNNDDDAIAADSEVDEEIQSPETLNHQSVADEGEEA